MKYSSEPVSKEANSAGNQSERHSQEEKLVSAEQLLRLLWDDESRPSLRWLREQQARRSVPFVKLGARVWFLPSEVRRHLYEKWAVGRR